MNDIRYVLYVVPVADLFKSRPIEGAKFEIKSRSGRSLISTLKRTTSSGSVKAHACIADVATLTDKKN